MKFKIFHFYNSNDPDYQNLLKDLRIQEGVEYPCNQESLGEMLSVILTDHQLPAMVLPNSENLMSIGIDVKGKCFRQR